MGEQHTYTFRIHPNGQQLPVSFSITTGENADARAICTYVPAIIQSVVSVSTATITKTGSSCQMWWYWAPTAGYNLPSGWNTNYGTNSPSSLPAQFVNSYHNGVHQLLYTRVSLSNPPKNINITGVTNILTLEVEPIHNVAIGDQVKRDDFYALADYINRLCTYLNVGAGLTIAIPNQGDPITQANWIPLVNKARTLPHVSNTYAYPTQYDIIAASYYNNLANTVFQTS